MTDLCDTGIVTWSEQQAALLRQLDAGARLNAPPDRDNVIEAIESVGQSRTDAIESLLFHALLHDLKATGWPLPPTSTAASLLLGGRAGVRATAYCTNSLVNS